jgi:hypothetical protein
MSSDVVSASQTAGNQVYYFDVGRGTWRGRFRFRVTSWRGFWQERSGIRNRFLVLGMAATQRVLGKATIDSRIRIFPGEGSFGVARNLVRIHKFRVTLYLLNESYMLDPNGMAVM